MGGDAAEHYAAPHRRHVAVLIEAEAYGWAARGERGR